MKIIVGSKIIIEGANDAVKKYCESLVLTNPEFYKKKNRGLWVGNTPPTISLFEKSGSFYILPFGCFEDIHKIAPHTQPENLYVGKFVDKRNYSYNSTISLFPYQERAAKEAFAKRNGVIVMPCGAGKTQTGLDLVSRIGGKTLWLTHTQDLLNQSLNRAKANFDCDNSAFGTITGGKVNISNGITFATVQTMAKLDLPRYRDEWDVVIVDECHKAVGSPTKVMQFYKVLSNLSARYKYGLTATPKRSDGLERSMFALLGNICARVTREEVERNTCPVIVRTVHTGYFPEFDAILSGDGMINYAALVEDMVSDPSRIDYVMSVLRKCDNATMVLGNRVEYLKTLSDLYNQRGKKSICLSALGTSKSAKEQRKRALVALNNGELDCVFATYQLAKEGLDVPNLRYLVLATPEKDETTVVQSVGRVARKSEGKKMGVVYDLIDSFGMYKGWAKTRQRYYKKLGIPVNDDGKIFL